VGLSCTDQAGCFTEDRLHEQRRGRLKAWFRQAENSYRLGFIERGIVWVPSVYELLQGVRLGANNLKWRPLADCRFHSGWWPWPGGRNSQRAVFKLGHGKVDRIGRFRCRNVSLGIIARQQKS
jgi:hypothetical protein